MIDINKNKYLYLTSIIILLAIFTFLTIPKKSEIKSTNKLTATIINTTSNKITVQDEENIIYTFSVEKNNLEPGTEIIIEYSGLLDKNQELQTTNLIDISPVSQDEEEITPRSKNNLFSQFDTLALNKLKEMTLDEKIGQIILTHYTNDNYEEAIEKYKVGGFLFLEENFQNKTKEEVKSMINKSQEKTKIPLLTAVNEEGGEVVSISSNNKIRESSFLSPRELYLKGGFDLIASDTQEKSLLLENLGLNINLAPVVDVSTNKTDYMYNRTLGEPTELVSQYAKTVIEANKKTLVSYVLKYFPGHGNDKKVYMGEVTDKRTKEEIEKNDFLPFESGIKSGAEAILIGHNIVQSMDQNNPASLSASVHNILRNELGFNGIIVTDDLSMAAISKIESATIKAILAGNDIIITNDYKTSFNEIKKAVEEKIISEELINNIAQRIISWKYYKGLMYNKIK